MTDEQMKCPDCSETLTNTENCEECGWYALDAEPPYPYSMGST